MQLVTKGIGKGKVYYLHHTRREGKEYKNYDLYLGKVLPGDLEFRKYAFFEEVYADVFKEIVRIKEKIKKEEKNMPLSVEKKNLFQFGIKFTYNTNRIEGSTLSIKDTKDAIEDNILPDRKPISDVIEAKKHQELFLKIIESKEDVSYSSILYWHKFLFTESKGDIAGKVRTYPVWISGSKFNPPGPNEVDFELKDFFKWYEKNKQKLDPIILSSLVHFKFVSVHPFGDGNGRISRLMMNAVLNRFRYPLFIIDYKNRRGYYNALEKSNVENNELHFVAWYLKNYLKYLKSDNK
ncbi:MAG: Fic family protein [Candidatus ainarchaeum sp.]|nr:Fic family protein [Candidatus ainarchaeum sp.]